MSWREHLPARLIKPLIALVAFQVAVCLADLILPPDMSRAREASAVALDRNGAWLRALPVAGGTWRIRADLARTDPQFLKHLLKTEDERFYLHLGVDPIAIVRAFGSNLRSGNIVSGGSTITMQTARLLEPKPRTYIAKITEIFRAFQLEMRYSKRDILSIYLTLAPYGGNLEGVRAASLSYFGQEPQNLTLGQQALLIALPQAPEARRPDRHPERALNARNLVLQRLADRNIISQVQLIEAREEPVASGRLIFNAHAWHAAGRLASEAARINTLQPTVVTTIDAPLQTRLEALARRTAIEQGPDSSVAIMVIDLKSRAVRASVGSSGLDRAGGWIDMTEATRSPGSALKPFIYGMGFEDGIIAPDTRLIDAPTRFGDYQPENFDRAFHGEVSAREALTHSLNIPAVTVLNRIGVGGFEGRLASVGVDLKRPKAGLRDAGLALALGGAGIKLADLALLYAALDDGIAKPLAWTQAEEAANLNRRGTRFLQKDAAARVVSILRETPPPDGRLPAHLMKSGNRPAYKTGTSYGYRDALAAGLAGGYAVLVWTGRPDGGARAGQTGREASAPLLFDVFDQINTPSQAPQALGPARAPEALKTLETGARGPSILFPPDGARLYVETDASGQKRGLKLSARGKGPLSWYINGLPVDSDLIWVPESDGFYDLSVIDTDGHIARSHVRVQIIGTKPPH
ncbi:MAG: penicillin-binding protein 1C [Asticcacaulis sp.]